MLAIAAEVEDAEEVRKVIASTSLFWLLPLVERLMALLGHASTRALVLLGVAKGKPLMVCWGFLLFCSHRRRRRRVPRYWQSRIASVVG